MLKYATDPAFADDRDALGFTTLLVTAGLAAVLWAVVALLAAPLAGVLLDDATRAPLVRLAGAYAALKVVATVPYMAMRVEERAGWYVAGLVVEFAVLVGGVYYFLAVERMGLDGVLVGYVLSAAAAAVLLSAGLLVRSRWQFRRGLVVPLFRFGVPLTFASLATVLLNTGDRFLLDGFVGAEAVAVYGLAQKFGGLVNMLFVQSFSMAFAVLGLKALGSLSDEGGEVGNLHRRTFRHYAVLTGWGVLGVSLLAFDVTEFVSPNPAYLDADPLVLPIALGFMAYGVYIIMMNVLYATAQTKRIAGNVLGSAVLNLALNAALIPLFGAMGAALATFAAYAGLAAITTWQARRAVAIAFPVERARRRRARRRGVVGAGAAVARVGAAGAARVAARAARALPAARPRGRRVFAGRTAHHVVDGPGLRQPAVSAGARDARRRADSREHDLNGDSIDKSRGRRLYSISRRRSAFGPSLYRSSRSTQHILWQTNLEPPSAWSKRAGSSARLKPPTQWLKPRALRSSAKRRSGVASSPSWSAATWAP